jgi:hypothetical protein
MDTLEFLQGALTVAGGVGGAVAAIGTSAGVARAMWRAGGQWGIDYDYRKAALDAQVELEKARAEITAHSVTTAAALQPRSLHYAPHITNPTSATSATSTSAPTSEEQTLPGVVDLADVALVPGRVLLGLGAGGQAITTTPAALMHIGCIGATGSGKTNAARVLLAQLLAMGGSDVFVANPHHVSNDIDNPTGGDWRAIERQLAAPAAYDERDMGELLDQLAASVDDRWAVKREGRRVGKAQVLYIDELPAILENVAGAIQSMSTILRRGRAVGIYLLSLSQDLAAKTLGKDAPGAIRENFRTAIYSGGDPHSASLLLDMPRRDLAGYERDLGRGVALVKAHQQHPTLARIPYASNGAVRALLGDGSEDMVTIPETEETVYVASETAETVSSVHEYAGIITRLRAQGMGKKAVIETVWGCKPGGSPAYQTASKIYDQVVAGG